MHDEFSDDHPGVVWPEKQKLPLLFPRWDGEALTHGVTFRLRRAIFGPAFGLPRFPRGRSAQVGMGNPPGSIPEPQNQ